QDVLGVAGAKLIEQVYRVVEAKEGYRLARVDVFDVRQGDEPYHAQVEAATGEIFELRPLHHYISGHAHGQLHRRYYAEELVDLPFGHVNISLADGSTVQADTQGLFEAPLDTNPSINGLSGSIVAVNLVSGEPVVKEAAME